KIQPTLFNGIFGVILLAGRLRGMAVMKLFFGAQFQLTQATWLTLSMRWGIFFCCNALMNEWAWRNLSDDGWVYFKIFFVAPLSLLFMAAQIPITLRGRTDKAD
ncbi:MAG: inner membrane-spanning protein YciB, partial [Candidatus Puniceispirillaceae bacterium]